MTTSRGFEALLGESLNDRERQEEADWMRQAIEEQRAAIQAGMELADMWKEPQDRPSPNASMMAPTGFSPISKMNNYCEQDSMSSQDADDEAEIPPAPKKELKREATVTVEDVWEEAQTLMDYAMQNKSVCAQTIKNIQALERKLEKRVSEVEVMCQKAMDVANEALNEAEKARG